uniref:Uncharacterized protein n=1 Tax=Oryza barthii TaxID=65489 RepID=A0A0D3ENW6_9ORYZ
MTCVPLSFPPPSLLLTLLAPSQVFSSIVVGPSMAFRPTSIAIGAASIHSIISTVCELELEMWYLPISCESFEPSGSQLLKRPGRICLHLQVVIHYFDKQSAEFINSAAGAITVSYVMQLLTGLLGREFSAVIYATQSISDILSISGGE